jgi:hypothetical protein
MMRCRICCCAKYFAELSRGAGGARVGQVSEQLAAAALRDGSFVRVADAHLGVPLYWQCWKLDSPMIKTITEAVGSSAASLHRRRN